MKGKLQNVTLKKCRLQSKAFGNILLGVVQGNSVESLNVFNNEIGFLFGLKYLDDHGVMFLCNLLRYYEKLTFFNICQNKFQATGFNELRRALKFSKRFNIENAIFFDQK
jgi:hypothetical protein